MRRKKGRLVLLMLIVACVAGNSYKVSETVLIRKANELRNNPLRFLDALPEAALQLKDFRRTHVDDGRKVWEVAGEEALYLKDQGEVVRKQPTFIYYDKDGNSLEVNAAEGHLYLIQQEMDRMELNGTIEMTYRGLFLETEKVIYFKSRNQVVLPGLVKVKGDGLELEGIGMDVTLDDEKLRLSRNVRSRMEPGRLKNQKVGRNGQTR